MGRPRKERKRYYWTEISSETASVISSACETLATLICGRMDVMESIVFAAIKKRTGEEPEEGTKSVVRDLLKNIQYIGWDSTYGNKMNIHGYSGGTDAMFDVVDVLNYQMKMDGNEKYEQCHYPMHWNDDVPLIRIVRCVDSKFNRNKQLAIYPNEKE